MRQVPVYKDSYLIIGNGKLSKHFQYYFRLKKIPYKVWTRGSKLSFLSLAQSTTKILVLIKDDEIEKFINDKRKQIHHKPIWIHCSGVLSSPLAESAHPLMTFGKKLYDLKFYENIPFITEKGRLDFGNLFPALKNKSFEIASEDKIMYHAFCVISGNFTTIIWQQFFRQLEKIGIPKKAAYPYLGRTIDNLIMDKQPLTGPLQRNDKGVILKHLKALKNSHFKEIYKAFLNLYQDNKKAQQR